MGGTGPIREIAKRGERAAGPGGTSQWSSLMPSKITPARSLAVAALCCCLATTTATARETINFDFAWRHQLTPAPPPSPRGSNCTAGEEGVIYGDGNETSGTAKKHVPTGWDCCQLCAADPSCGCWSVDPKKGMCYLRSVCTTKTEKKGRISALLAGDVPATPPTPAPTPGPMAPTASPSFDDSAWQLIDAPHDMLVNQKPDPQHVNTMAFIPRNVGWYRKVSAQRISAQIHTISQHRTSTIPTSTLSYPPTGRARQSGSTSRASSTRYGALRPEYLW